MKGVYDCEIITQNDIGPGVVRTLLKGREIAQEALPGQFVNVQVAKTTDPLLRRPFSIHAVYPEEGVYTLLYVLRGRGTALLRKLPPGEKISVIGPLGKGFDLGDSPEAEHIVVAGGCGAAPLHFLCDALCARWGCEKVTVLAGAQNKDALLCEAEFKSHGVSVGVSTDDGSYGYHGYVTQLLAEHLVGEREEGRGKRKERYIPSPLAGEGWGEGDSQSIRVYTCGPHAMLKEVARICRESGVDNCQVSLENTMACGIGVCMGCVQKIRGERCECESGKADSSHSLGMTSEALGMTSEALGMTSGTPRMTSEHWHHERVCTDGPVFNAEDVIWD